MNNVQYVKVYDENGFEWDSEIVFYADEMSVMVTGITGAPFDLENTVIPRLYDGYIICEKYGEVFAEIRFAKGYRKIESVMIKTVRKIRDDDSGETVNHYHSR